MDDTNMTNNMHEKGWDGRRERPICIAIVICSEVIEDKRTNNKTLVSLFNRIITPAIPSVHPRMFVMASLTNGLGKWPITFRIKSLTSDREIMRLNGEADFKDPLAVLDLVFEVRNLPLQEEGVYVVDVLAENRPIAERRFTVASEQEEAQEEQG